MILDFALELIIGSFLDYRARIIAKRRIARWGL